MLISSVPADVTAWLMCAAALGLAVRPSKRLIARLAAGAVILGVGAWIFYQPGGPSKPAERPAMEIVIGQWAKDALLEMQFAGGTAEECRAWQKQFAAKLGQLLGPYEPPATWQTQVERVVHLPDHDRHELILRTEGHPDLPVYLLVPKGRKGPRPGIVAVHGHGPAAYDAIAGRTELPEAAAQIDHENSNYGLQLVRKGYVVAAPCLTPFGRRLGNRDDFHGEDPCAITFVRMQLLDEVLKP